MIGMDDEREYEAVVVSARLRERGREWENLNLLNSGRRLSYEITVKGPGRASTRTGVVYVDREISDGDRIKVTPRVRAPGIANRTINVARLVTAADVIVERRRACS